MGYLLLNSGGLFMAIQKILGVALLVLGFQTSISSAEPIKFERTSASPKKVHFNIPVEFSRNECTEFIQVPYQYWRYNYYPCGYRGRAMCSYPYYYTGYTSQCVRYELKTRTEMRDVVLKFRKGTDIPAGDVEEYTIQVSQAAFDSSSVYVNVTPIRTHQPYRIINRGRKVIFKLPKN